MTRNYKREYETYHSKPEQIKRRSERNSSRKKVEKEKGKAAIKGKVIDHKDHNTTNQSKKNLKVMSRSANASKNKGKGGRPKGSGKKK